MSIIVSVLYGALIAFLFVAMACMAGLTVAVLRTLRNVARSHDQAASFFNGASTCAAYLRDHMRDMDRMYGESGPAVTIRVKHDGKIEGRG